MLTDPESKQITEGLDSKVSKGTYCGQINIHDHLDTNCNYYIEQYYEGLVIRSPRLSINHSKGARYAY